MDSPSRNKEAGDRMGQWFARQFQQITGGTVKHIPNIVHGDLVYGEIGTGERHLLLLGHYDTVWPDGEAARRPFRAEGNKAFGPGVYDMKAGLLQAMFALKLLTESSMLPKDMTVKFLINSDEELGSRTTRFAIEEIARSCAAAFVLEPPMEPTGALKTSRKGSGRYRLTAHGIAAHAGVNPEKGVSAMVEMAHHILRLHGMTDFEEGTTVNVGTIQGGIGCNVVADRVEAEIDVRVSTVEAAGRIEAAMNAIQPVLPGASVTVSGGMIRPPMERTEAIGRLFGKARDIARELGLELSETGTGGVSDGNFVAALGIPTLDGLGARGDFAHSPNEFIRLDEVAVRVSLLAQLIQRF